MTNRKKTKLSYIMDLFGVTGHELANNLHVDYSLVSKWRNHSRVLTPRSSNLKKISEYIVALDSNKHYYTLTEILSEAYPNIALQTPAEISVFLAKWLSDNNGCFEDDNSVSSIDNSSAAKGQFYLFKDNAGRREAVNKLLDIALSSPEGQELLLFSQEESSWFSEDDEFINMWRDKNLDFLHKGGKIRVIHNSDRLYKSIAFSLIQWLPLEMTGNTSQYFFPQSHDASIVATLYVLKDRAAIMGLSTGSKQKMIYTYMYFDAITIQQCELALRSLMTDSMPLFRNYSNNTDKLKELLMLSDQTDKNSYHVTMPPSFNLMSQKLLKDILTQNNFNENEIDMYLNYHSSLQKQFFANDGKKHYRYIYDIYRLERLLSSNDNYQSSLSILSGRNIILSRNMFCRCLEEMIYYIERVPNLEIALLEGPPAPGLDDINLWIKEDTIAISSTVNQTKNAPLSLASMDMTAVNSCYYSFNKIWNSIPQIMRDRGWVRQRLFHALSKYRPDSDNQPNVKKSLSD